MTKDEHVSNINREAGIRRAAAICVRLYQLLRTHRIPAGLQQLRPGKRGLQVLAEMGRRGADQLPALDEGGLKR